MPGSMIPFKLQRPRDINLEIAIGSEVATKEFYIFKEIALNTFDKKLAQERSLTEPIKQTLKIEVIPLGEILQKHCSQNQKIDFLSIDVEGLDFEILRTNDWGKFRPQLLCVEIYAKNINEVLAHEIYIYLVASGYQIIYRVNNSCFFELQS